MKKINFIKASLTCLTLNFSFMSYANCPKIEDIKQKNDGTHYVHDNSGIWNQFINYQSFQSLNEEVKLLRLYYIFGMKKNQSDNNFQQIVCFYRVVDEDNKYIVLVSPISNFKITIKENSLNKNEWKMLQPTRAVCIPEHYNTQEINFKQCEFEEIL